MLLKKVPFCKVYTYCKDVGFGGNVLIITGRMSVCDAEYLLFSAWLCDKGRKALILT